MRFRRFILISFSVMLITVCTVMYLVFRDTGSLHRVDVKDLADRDLLQYLALPADVRKHARSAETDEQLDAVLREFFGPRPGLRGLPHPGPPDDLLANAQLLRSGQLQLGSHEAVAISLPPDWSMDPAQDKWRGELHSLSCVVWLIHAFEQSGDEANIALADEIVFDWIRTNPGTGVSDHPPWDGQTIARRLESLLRFWDAYRSRPLGGNGTAARLLLSIKQHADWLTLPSEVDRVYFAADPRGVRQDLAVLATVLAIPQMKDADRWNAVASDRLLRFQIHSDFLGAGQPRYSPADHLASMRKFDSVRRLFQANAATPVPALDRALDGMESFASHTLLPDGTLPAIGPAGEAGQGLDLEPARLERFMYARTAGATGRRPVSLDGSFPISGYAIFRDTWGDETQPAAQATYVNFHAAHHVAGDDRPAHDDELSFILHGVGRSWIVEAGTIRGGQDDADLRAYAAGPAGHNAYVGRDAEYDREAQTQQAALIGAMLSKTDLAAARGESHRYPSTSFVRTLVFVRSLRVLVVVDEINASLREDEWTGLLHLAPDLIPEIDGLHATCRAPNRPWTLEIVSSSGITTRLEAVRGVRETSSAQGRDEEKSDEQADVGPDVQGWVGNEHGEPLESTTLLLHRPGREWRVVTVLQLHHNDEPAVHSVSLEADAASHTVSFKIGEQQHVMQIGTDEPLKVKHTIAE